MINKKIVLSVLGLSLLLTGCEANTSSEGKSKSVEGILTSQEASSSQSLTTSSGKNIEPTTTSSSSIVKQSIGLDIDAIASGDFSSIVGMWSMDGSEYIYDIRKNDIVVEGFPYFKVVNTYKENGSAIIVYDTPGPTGGSEMGAIVVIPAGKNKPVSHMSEAGDKSKDRVLFVTPQRITKVMVKGGKLDVPKVNSVTTTANNKTVDIKAGYTDIAGRYIGDNGKEYIFTSEGTLEVDGVIYSLGKSNKSRNTRTNEEFINYNLKEDGNSHHSGSYVEVYKDRIEVAYSGPVKSTVLKKQ